MGPNVLTSAFDRNGTAYSPSSALCSYSQSSAFSDCHHAALPSLALGRGCPSTGTGSTTPASRREDLFCAWTSWQQKQCLDWHQISLQATFTGLSYSHQRAPAASSESPVSFSAVFARLGAAGGVLACAAIITEHYIHPCAAWLGATGSFQPPLVQVRGSIKSSCLQLPNWTANCFFGRGKNYLSHN